MFRGPIPEHPVVTAAKSFDELGLSDGLRLAVAELGWQHPTPVQAAAIPPAIAGRDLVGLAETGSGKTAAFAIPLAERLGSAAKRPRGLVLSPTRELTLQTKAFLDYFGAHHHLRAASLIGGVDIRHQMQALRAKPDLLVATPGRLLDHLERGTVTLERIEELVLDEADHMLDLGFLPQIHAVLEQLPKKRHTMMFSATMPPEIERLMRRFLLEPEIIDLRPKGRTAAGIQHRLYLVDEDNKKPCIFSLLNEELGTTLVFTRRKSDAEWLSRVLERAGHPVERIHGDLPQSQRFRALAGFREGQHRILVATDVASRGLDVVGIEHVINFDIPETVDDYVHRAGRTARGNAEGIVSTIATWRDKTMVREIEQAIGQTIPRCVAAGVEPYVELPVRRAIRRRML